MHFLYWSTGTIISKTTTTKLLFTTGSAPNTLMTTMTIPSSFEDRTSIVQQSIKNIIKWAKNNQFLQYFKIQVLEYGEVQVYPSLAYYLVPLLIST
jgi:hypothetical protein